MMEKITQNEYFISLVKILIPAILGVGVKLAVEMKKDKTKVSLFNVVLSMIIGVSGAWLSSDVIMKVCGSDYQSIAIAFVAIISDKIAEFIIYKFQIDEFMTAFLNGLFDWISNTFKRQ